MSGAPDLFVVCKSCGSEVSPYITECPYCGQRLRKRAPKIERDEGGEAKQPKAPRQAKTRRPEPELPSLETIAEPRRKRGGRLRGPRRGHRDDSALFGADETRRPNVTIALVALSVLGAIALAAMERGDAALVGPVDGEWWRVVTTTFLYDNAWYQFVVVLAIGLFGWSLERRHGPVLVLALFAACAVGGTAVAAVLEDVPVALGAAGAGLGFLAAWAIPVMRARKRTGDHDDDADLIGAFVIGAAVALMPAAAPEASGIAAAAGLVLGAACGLMLDRVAPRDR